MFEYLMVSWLKWNGMEENAVEWNKINFQLFGYLKDWFYYMPHRVKGKKNRSPRRRFHSITSYFRLFKQRKWVSFRVFLLSQPSGRAAVTMGRKKKSPLRSRHLSQQRLWNLGRDIYQAKHKLKQNGLKLEKPEPKALNTLTTQEMEMWQFLDYI